MVIREAGILFRGFTLVKKSYHKSTKGKIDRDLRSALLTALLDFAQSTFSQGTTVEYFEGKKYIITFLEDEIIAEDSLEPEPLLSYVILDKEKKADKYIYKVIQPFLKVVLKEFKSLNNGKNLSEISRFKGFKQNLDKILGSDTHSIDQKFKGIL